jgi:hypothetical protein
MNDLEVPAMQVKVTSESRMLGRARIDSMASLDGFGREPEDNNLDSRMHCAG